MSTMIWAAVGIGVGLLIPLLVRFWQRSADAGDLGPAAPRTAPRARTPAAPPANASAKVPARKFHGVTIKPCPEACEAVLALVDQRFLPEQVPALPLPGCDQKSCRCGYRHHGDRRDAEDRRSGWGSFGGFAPSLPGGNRRAKARDRRAGHKADPAS